MCLCVCLCRPLLIAAQMVRVSIDKVMFSFVDLQLRPPVMAIR